MTSIQRLTNQALNGNFTGTVEDLAKEMKKQLKKEKAQNKEFDGVTDKARENIIDEGMNDINDQAETNKIQQFFAKLSKLLKIDNDIKMNIINNM